MEQAGRRTPCVPCRAADVTRLGRPGKVRLAWVRVWVRTAAQWRQLSHPTGKCGWLSLQVDVASNSAWMPHNPLAVGSSPTRPTLTRLYAVSAMLKMTVGCEFERDSHLVHG
jgi:hypothetical protein